jgi:molybdate transport system substrate-binding protein
VTAVEIKVQSTHAAFEVLSELGPRFERATGHRLSIGYDPTNVIRRRIDDGAAFDVAIVTRPVIDELAAQGKIVADSCIDIGRSGLGVAVRAGAPMPYIATVEAFKRALLAAKSVVRSKDGASGQYFATLLDRLDITEAMRGKIRLGASGRVAELVAGGEVAMAVQQIAELLPVAGAQFVGPFPAELQVYTVFAAGIGSAAPNRQGAAALISALTAPSAAALFKAKGLEPINR